MELKINLETGNGNFETLVNGEKVVTGLIAGDDVTAQNLGIDHITNSIWTQQHRDSYTTMRAEQAAKAAQAKQDRLDREAAEAQKVIDDEAAFTAAVNAAVDAKLASMP